ncbi:MAG: hypothetical protein KAT75_08725, partial [Dehalococcoidia bacterium]|nr:hypothetical protein [Dehalococcoidia bacterium]
VGLTLALLTSLLLTAAPVSANVSEISVVLSDDDISAMANYTVTFKVNVDLPTAATTDTITVVFPVGTDASALTADGDVKIRNTAGTWGTLSNIQINIPAADVTVATDKITVTIVVDNVVNDILAGATVEIVFGNTKILNPPTAATGLTLTVATSTETTAVASPAYAIALPEIAVLPGVVEVRNASGILMSNWTGDDAIADAIGDAGANFTINVGEGTYAWNLTIPAALTDLELAGAEGAVIKGVQAAAGEVGLRIDASGVTVHGFTIATTDAALSLTLGDYIYGIVVANEDVEIYDNAFVATCAGTVDAIMIATDSLEPEEVSGLSIHDNTFTADTVSTVASEGIYVNCNSNHLDPASTTAASLI